MNDQELQNLEATVAGLETAIEMTNRGERVSLAGARRQHRRVLWIGTLGLCAPVRSTRGDPAGWFHASP